MSSTPLFDDLGRLILLSPDEHLEAEHLLSLSQHLQNQPKFLNNIHQVLAEKAEILEATKRRAFGAKWRAQGANGREKEKRETKAKLDQAKAIKMRLDKEAESLKKALMDQTNMIDKLTSR